MIDCLSSDSNSRLSIAWQIISLVSPIYVGIINGKPVRFYRPTLGSTVIRNEERVMALSVEEIKSVIPQLLQRTPKPPEEIPEYQPGPATLDDIRKFEAEKGIFLSRDVIEWLMTTNGIFRGPGKLYGVSGWMANGDGDGGSVCKSSRMENHEVVPLGGGRMWQRLRKLSVRPI